VPQAKIPVVLTIAGFDPSSGAGITADLKSIASHGSYGVAAITALTVQSTQGASRVEPVAADVVRETLTILAKDMPFAAIKVGMLGSAEIANVVADFLEARGSVPVVLDPVLRSSSGAELLDQEGTEVLRRRLLKLCLLVTPNLAEAEVLSGQRVSNLDEMRAAAAIIQRRGAKNVVITGGHLAENTDLLRLESGEEIEVKGPRVESKSTHGTGCAFSTAIACRLAAGCDLRPAVGAAKEYVRQAIEAAYPLGQGIGPLNHLFRLKKN
jgi:hydroxymethylpyrimidine/phosphomethylpyrimidine kinase